MSAAMQRSKRPPVVTAAPDLSMRFMMPGRSSTDRLDVVDGDYGIPEPTKAMRLAGLIDEAIAKAEASHDPPPCIPSNLSLREDEQADQLLYQQQTAAPEFRTLVSRYHRRGSPHRSSLWATRRRATTRASVVDLMNDLLQEHPA